MPVPRKRGIDRRTDWTNRHLAHLLSGHDWPFMGPEGWSLTGTDDEICATVDDMAACWRANQHLVTAEHCGLNDVFDEPWFAQYAADPEQLVLECIAERDHARRYPHGEICQCEQCLARVGKCSPHCPFCSEKQEESA